MWLEAPGRAGFLLVSALSLVVGCLELSAGVGADLVFGLGMLVVSFVVGLLLALNYRAFRKAPHNYWK